MTRRRTTDDTLLELWMIKDETAQRFRTAAEYFQYLGMNKIPQKQTPSEQPRKMGPPPTVTASARGSSARGAPR